MNPSKLEASLTTASELLLCIPCDDAIDAALKGLEGGYGLELEKDGPGIVVTIQDVMFFCAAKFSMTPMRGNSSILVFHDAEVAESHRGKGLGTRLHGLRLEWAARYKASMVMCTVIDGNAAEESILRRFEWRQSGHTVNLKTGNRYTLYTRLI